ncbi:hypothetical protein [Microbacterium sp.]|uniref:hypothetical protein n=1 Tax=Microbacterium sp. TaxID=51671 RepID=UPI002E31C087|nr:hypothetical protein [Microbacterium sp.]HEX5730843.1 hypothetical protein [Microbacterium sp.]
MSNHELTITFQERPVDVHEDAILERAAQAMNADQGVVRSTRIVEKQWSDKYECTVVVLDVQT